jgi:hypothetical protein
LKGCRNVSLYYAPLEENWPDFVWYRAPPAVELQNYALVVCDGPPRKWGREGLFCLLEKQIAGAHWLLDDINSPDVDSMLKRYAGRRQLHALHPEGSERPFGVMPAAQPLPQTSRMFA